MKRIKHVGLIVALAATAMIVGPSSAEKPGPSASRRDRAAKLQRQGNYKEAYEIYAALALDPADDVKLVGGDLTKAIQCLQQLNRASEIDEFREKVIKVHAGNWWLLHTAANTYLDVRHDGFMIAGEFRRGGHRGGGKYVNSYERDRVRALQLMQQAMGRTRGEDDRGAVARFYLSFAQMLMGRRGYSEAWRLQYLTDLTKLPDYEPGRYYGWRHYGYGASRGAPVEADGKPVFHHLPKTWQAAKTDGQRWRWCLLQAVEYNSGLNTSVRMQFADFLRQQFGVQTMARYGRFLARRQMEEATKDTSGTWELHTLKETETIAKLATGIRRLTLPDEFNFIRIYRSLAANYEPACQRLCEIFENRRQYPTAAELWRKNIARFGPGHKSWKKNRLAQIVENWGMFEPVLTQPAEKGASVEFRFRNGKKVHFTAHAVKVSKLLEDVKAYLKSGPKRLDWQKMRIDRIGWMLVNKDRKEYIGRQVASWDLDLEPRANHWDRRITVTTPLQKPGAYLLTATMTGGNTSKIIIWVADTAIVKKTTVGHGYYFVADAVTGKPVGKANVEFFGYWQEYIRHKNERGRYVIHTRNFAEFTDADGQVTPDLKDTSRRYQWIVTATTPGGRFAYLGFTGVWSGRYYDRDYKATKTFVMTDRPVYRPKQTVKFKFWVNHARYDVEGKSAFAGQTFRARINDGKGKKVFEKSFKLDEFGGADGELPLKPDAVLGRYYISIRRGPRTYGGGAFRVEEYKKPEFEVKIEAPQEPIALGEKFSALIKADYYFGGPVKEAKVSYKVLRSEHDTRWFHPYPWDWLFGPGYWWCAYDYTWFPGWRKWGCFRPVPWWWWGRWVRREPPEVVAEGRAKIGHDGTLKVEIDTSVAKALYGDVDHRYEITAEVTDKSRRTIVGTGKVLVARRPFKVYAWVNRGYYRVGDTIRANFRARRLDGKAVQGAGELRLLRVTYKAGKPVEAEVNKWKLDTDQAGKAAQQIKASRAGQYRLSYKVTDAKKHTIEGGYVFVIRGKGFDGSQFRFDDIELVTDKAEYRPGDKVRLMINTNRSGAAVLLFIRPANGVYLKPKILRLTGKSTVHEIAVIKKDMPNFFIEAVTVHGAKVHTDVRQIVVPPAKRILNVKVTPAAKTVKPGAKTKVAIKLTDHTGEPYSGSAVVTIYDKAVEYISGGSNVPEIKAFFWKWRRNHSPRTEHSLSKGGRNLVPPGQLAMSFLGVFGRSVATDAQGFDNAYQRKWGVGDESETGLSAPARGAVFAGTPKPMESMRKAMKKGDRPVTRMEEGPGHAPPPEPKFAQAAVRTKFADTALWVGSLTTGKDGKAEVELTMPENLSTWMTRVWAMGRGTRVGQGTAEMITTKNLLVRLQAPRFFVQKDEVVLSANVHNRLKSDKTVRVILETEGPCLEAIGGQLTRDVKIPAGGEIRLDWRVKVVEPGKAVVRVKALSDEESDAMQMSFPVYVHGMLKTESFCGVIRPDKRQGQFEIRVPAERREAQSRLEIRYSPTLAGAMVDALPYLAAYPYGCTEQTLNRFLPTVITQKVLIGMGLDLDEIRRKRTNLNAQEIGEDRKRAKQWKRYRHNPVFDRAEVNRMVKAGLERLTNMQLSDGGWGWFSGWGERSWPHTTAVVVHGLQIARANDVAVVPGVITRGIEWLKRYQARELQELINGRKAKKVKPWKARADALDALVYMVLVDEKIDNKQMRTFLYEDRNHLPVYAKAMFGMACHKVADNAKRDMLIRNVEQYLVQDDENQSAWLNLPNAGYWWYWYGSEYEAHAYYLKLLSLVDPKGVKASRLVKYLLNNRKHATYWKSTRDTALCVEAFADFIKASGEDKPNMTVQVLVDGKKLKEVRIDSENLFAFDNKLVLEGKAVTTGKHKVRLVKKGTGPLYFNAYLTNFTLEDHITAAGLEIKVNRKYYKLVRVEKTVKSEGARGQALDRKVEKYERKPLKNLDELVSGDKVEIELTIASKNDYEYIIFEDMKAAGFEPIALRSGYGGNEMGAYMELRDERVTFFVRRLARGRHSLSYRMRAEIPGKFSALPTKASAMYAPELKANSDEIKLRIVDAE